MCFQPCLSRCCCALLPQFFSSGKIDFSPSCGAFLTSPNRRASVCECGLGLICASFAACLWQQSCVDLRPQLTADNDSAYLYVFTTANSHSQRLCVSKLKIWKVLGRLKSPNDNFSLYFSRPMVVVQTDWHFSTAHSCRLVLLRQPEEIVVEKKYEWRDVFSS